MPEEPSGLEKIPCTFIPACYKASNPRSDLTTNANPT